MRSKSVIVFKVILIVSLPIFLLFTALHTATNNLDFYESKYQEYNISKVTGIDLDDLMNVTEELLSYLKGNRDNIIIYEEINGETKQVFKEREILHLKDVEELFDKSYDIKNIALVLSIISIFSLWYLNKKGLSKALIMSALVPVGVIVVFAIIASTDFYQFFTYFHEILFTNDLWLLDPDTEVLIQMYPLDFFKSISLRIFAYFLIQLTVVLGLGLIMKSRIRNNNY